MSTSKTKQKTKGSIYVLTIVSAIVLTAVVLGLSKLALQFRRSSQIDTDIDCAEIHAELGIRHGLYATSAISNWRTVLPDGTWLEDIAIGNVTYSVTVVDPIDSSISNSPEDPVSITCTAVVNDVTRSIKLQAQQPPSELLQFSLAANGHIHVYGEAVVDGDIFANNDIFTYSEDAEINGNAESAGSIVQYSGDIIEGDIIANSQARPFPNAQQLYDYYLERATEIPHQSTIDGVLIAPSSNPFGPTNAAGLYYINCSGSKITIKNCRIIGTLIIIEPGNNSIVKNGMVLENKLADFPSLIIIDGDIKLQFDEDTLDEEYLYIDFSLPGEPGYGDMSDIYQSHISGAVYSNSNLHIEGHTMIFGPVIAAGNIELYGDSYFSIESWQSSPTPRCFREEYLIPTADTWNVTIP